MASLVYLAPLRINDSTGAPAANLSVHVSAAVYQDAAGLIPYPNQTVTSDGNGNITFYATAGSYTLNYTPTNAVGQVVTLNLPLQTSSASSQVLVGSSGSVAVRSLFGQGPTVPIRSNLEFAGVFAGPLVDTAGASVAASGVMAAVPVPVDVGMVVSKISIFVGATAASTPTHNFGALYSGTAVASPPLIGQSTDGTTAAVAASTRFDFTLTAQQTITAAQAPNGWIWVAYSFTATTTLPSQLTVPCGAAAAQYRWFAGSPLYFSQTSGSAVAGTATATLINASTLTVAPVVAIS
jgi:hypothetical protein